MRSRSRRLSSKPDPERVKAAGALKDAFKHEVRPQDYLLNVWLTAIVAAVPFSYFAANGSGNFELSMLIPLGGIWQGHDPAGGLYLETWGSILVNSLQAGFGLWGAVLIFLGVFRVFTSHKYVFACFYLGIAFLGFALVLPNWTQILLGMLIEKCPILVQ